MKKRIVSLFLCAAMFCALIPTALAAEAGLKNFQTVNKYSTGQFTDVSSSAWYASNVKAAYELGLVYGTSSTKFDPSGNITIAQTLTLASRLHSIYTTGSGDFEQGSPWYQVYVDYAIENGIISDGQYTNFNAVATRAQFATILSAALPSSALTAINSVTSNSIPDVPSSASYASAVYTLYNAGILTGSDKYGTFKPNNSIQRSEVATIATRMADTSLRKTFTLGEETVPVTSISLSETSLSLGVGQVGSLVAIISPDDATDQSVTWSSSDNSVVPFSSSKSSPSILFSAKAVGTTVITATASNGATASVTVTVTEHPVNDNSDEVAYEESIVDSSQYAYLAVDDFHRIRRSYSSATAKFAYVTAYKDLDGELIVLTEVHYNIISNYSDLTMHNMTTGKRISDPSNYYDTLAKQLYGPKRIHIIDLRIEMLEHLINAEKGLEGITVDGRTLNL